MFLSPVDGHLRRRTTGSSHHVLARDSAWSKLSARRRGNPLHGPQSGEGEGSADKRQFGSSPPGNGNKDHRPSPPCRGFQCPGPVSQSPTPATPLPSPTETPPPSTPVPPVPAPSNPAPASSSNASPAPPVNAPTSIATQTTAEAPANSATSSTPSTGTGGTSALDSQSSAIPGVANSVSSQNSASIGADGLPASTQVDGTTHPFTTESGIPYIYTTNSAGVTVTVPYGVDPSQLP
ncbi:hypothetical protein BDZ97DRAFT_170655 [Flammula alnicola]|nr:hypothetical protein BDZ97DRAFT_170655 [Flammula alnicola]